MKFRIDLKIFIFLILFYFTKQIEIYTYMIIFCILHEIGHLIAGLVLGKKVEKIELMPWGITIEFKLDTDDYNKKILNSNIIEIKKIIIAISGPIINLCIIIIILFLDIYLKEKLIYANILILIFNLIPIYPLDGGRILKSILRIIYGNKKSEYIINKISNIIIIFITFMSSILLYSLKNISILLILLYLWILVIKENRKYKIKSRIYTLIKK